MEQAGRARAGASEQLDPGSNEPFVGGIVDGGKDAIRRIRTILVGGLERNGRSQWLRKLKRGRVVERVDVESGEEAPRVGRLARRSERARGERQLPAGGRQGASERARDLRRAATGEEKERRDDATTRTPHRWTAAAALVPVCLRVHHRQQFSPRRVARAERAASGAAASAGAVPGGYPISISAGRPSRPIARRWRKCERSAARSDGCDE